MTARVNCKVLASHRQQRQSFTARRDPITDELFRDSGLDDSQYSIPIASTKAAAEMKQKVQISRRSRAIDFCHLWTKVRQFNYIRMRMRDCSLYFVTPIIRVTL